MISGIGTQFEAQFVTLTTNIEDDQGNFYSGGEVGREIGRGRGDDPTILAKFDGRPALCVTPGDDCVIGRRAVA